MASALAAVLMVDPGSRSLAGAAAVSGVVLFPVFIGAAVFTYVQWRISCDEVARWLTMSLVVIAAPNLTLAGLVLAQPDGVREPPSMSLIVQALVMTTLLALALASARALPSFDPLGAGVVLGLVLSLLTIALATRPSDGLPSGLVVVLGLLPLIGALGLTRFLLTRVELPWWGRLRLSLAAVLLAVPEFASYAPRRYPAVVTVELGALIAGAGLLCCTSLALVRLSIQQNARMMEILHDRLDRAEALVRLDRARLHEIGATVAGIASASRLIHREPVQLTAPRRSLLEEMMEAEVARLERLMLGEPTGPRVFCLDELLRPLIVSQQAQGHHLAWQPSGHRVKGCPDDVAEIVACLLNNAARHGQDSDVTLAVRELDGVVEISVNDFGPGVPAGVRDRLFDWGVRGPQSPGQGIGLNIARDLVEKQGGYLMLEDSPRPGTTFVVGLPSGESNDAVGYIAG
ncbi:MAG: HAMP domain-containing sensor histidine kinase [Nocardioides sp.]